MSFLRPFATSALGSSLLRSVVEDDDDVRAYTVECLRELGYRVLEAHDGASGLRLIERQADPIDLLFTDVVMPNMTGRELADKARALQPGLKVLYTSGYTRDAIIHGGRLEPGVDMIAKPFTYHALGQQIRDALDRGRTGRLLVIQANGAVRVLTVEALTEAGYALDQAATGVEALSKIRAAQGRFDAVILDTDINGNGRRGPVRRDSGIAQRSGSADHHGWGRRRPVCGRRAGSLPQHHRQALYLCSAEGEAG